MRRIAIGLLGALGALCLLAAPAAAQTNEADARLDDSIQKLIQVEHGPPGVAVVVQRGKQRRLHSFGTGRLGSDEPIGLSDHVRIASVSKAFSGAVALQLVMKHKLSLDEPIGNRLSGIPAIWAPITLRQLLHHTSGLPSFSADPAFQAFVGGHLQDYISPEQTISYVFDDPLVFTPGSRYEYSNTDNVIVGLLAQAVTGRSYDDLLRSLVFHRFHLRDTSFPSTSAMPSPFAHGYLFDPDEDRLVDVSEEVSPASAWASGAIVSTPRDMNRFARAWGGGTFLTRKLRRQQTHFIADSPGQPRGPGENSDGLALFRYELGCGTVFGHSGNYPGYTHFVAANRDGKRSLSVSVNMQIAGEVVPPALVEALRDVFAQASCAALARGA